jgi:lipoyl(octanoyl) transferase
MADCTVNKRKLIVRKLGRIDYESGLVLQKETAEAIKSGTQPETLLLLEHPHTLTIGRRGNDSSVLLPEPELHKRGVKLFETNRGGKVTYHGLGQVVGYPIINLSPDREDVHRYVRDLEEVLLLTMRDFGIDAFRIKGLTGVHTVKGKVAAIGVHIARWITTHGFALNVNTDLSYYDLIIACEGEPVTSMHKLLAHEVDTRLVEDRLATRFAEVFDLEIEDPSECLTGDDSMLANLQVGKGGLPPL